MSWIHDRDFVRACRWLIDREDLAGPVKLAAPHPLSDADFMGALRAAWGIGVGLPATRWMLEVGALVLRTETEPVLKSRRVVPIRLLGSGVRFEFARRPEAAADRCGRWRALRVSA